jgi:glycosyltransferase involved in cell wall biosynthesis
MYNLTTTCRFGGVETFVWEVSRELAKREEEVHIIGGQGVVREKPPGVKIILFPFWPRERIPNLGTRFRKMGERFSFGYRAYPALIGERYDLLHIHKPYDLPWAWAIKKRTGCKVILGSHGTDFFPGDRTLISAVDRAVACSHFNAGQVRERYGITPRVIYNGIDPRVFRPLPPDVELRKKLGIPEESRVVVFVGRLIGLKGVHVLLRAMTRVDPRENWRLIIIGDGSARDEVRQLAQELGIRDRVLFPGYIVNRELPSYYSFADLAVFPSIADEAFGMSICEAMACGRAVLCTRVGGIPELVADGESGILVEPRNWQELGERINSLLSDPVLRSGLGTKALERTRNLFTWEKVADRLQGIYQEVAGRPGKEDPAGETSLLGGSPGRKGNSERP